MPSATASVTGEGIIFNKMRYSSKQALDAGWFEKARKKSWKETIQYDPRDVNHIYIGYQKYNLADKGNAFNGFRLEEIQEQQFFMKTQTEVLGTSQRQLKVDIDSQIKKIIKEETTSSKESRTGLESKAELLRDIKANRAEEKMHFREQEKWADTLRESKEELKSQVVYMEDFKREEDTDEESDHLLNLIINHDNEGGI
jgi:hypothetical protein